MRPDRRAFHREESLLRLRSGGWSCRSVGPARLPRGCRKPHGSGLPLGGANHARVIKWEVSERSGSENVCGTFPRLPPEQFFPSARAWHLGLPVDESGLRP